MKVLLNNIFPFGSYIAINLFGLVLSRRPLSKVERNHEYIHTLQQRELLWLGFYIWYGIEWTVRLIATRSTKRAYFSISFEREAYAHQGDLDYRHHRPFWAWRKCLRSKSNP
ncbi:MAG: hypothetical protein IJ832_06475 [Bacteroidaceae bacterium]|nr:hypothetical protein [Bacteroidaceae bacterium]